MILNRFSRGCSLREMKFFLKRASQTSGEEEERQPDEEYPRRIVLSEETTILLSSSFSTFYHRRKARANGTRAHESLRDFPFRWKSRKRSRYRIEPWRNMILVSRWSEDFNHSSA